MICGLPQSVSIRRSALGMKSPATKSLLAGIALLCSFGPVQTKADIFTVCGVDLGLAGRTKTWAALALGSGNVTDVTDFSAQSSLVGDVGAVRGDVKFSGGSSIHGDVYLHTTGHYKNSSTGEHPGAIHQDPFTNMLLDQAKLDAMNASMAAFNKPNMGPPGLTSLTNFRSSHGGNWNISGYGCVVLHLGNFMMTGGTFTLTGTATDAIIINLTGTLTLTGNTTFVLSGGLTWDSILFNIVGSGGDVQISGQAFMQGIILATQRRVVVNGSRGVFGEVIANRVRLTGSGRIVNPSVQSQF